ncbi:MAG: ABC transporter permease [Oscillospiraceae bacterium]|nr:ABC transporter permease [Oscillospiraceae bacterium]
MNRFFMLWKKFGMYALLIILAVGFSIASPNTFFTTTTLFNILKQASVTGVLSCGVTMMLLTGAIDLSCASRMAIITILVSTMMLNGIPIPVCILAGIAVGVLTGVLNAVLSELLHTTMFVTTLAINYVWTGVCYLTVGAATIYGLPTAFGAISQTLVFGTIPSIIFIFIACAVVASFVLGKTRFGRHVYAIGGNREAARLAGINVVKVNIMTHAVAGVFIAIGAIILMSRTMVATASTANGTYSFDCIIGCVLGGVLLSGGNGKMSNAIMGILVINVLFNGLTIIGVNDYWQMVVKGAILFLAIALDILQTRSVSRKKSISEEGGKNTSAEAV